LAVVGIVPAAGRGERLGRDLPKAFAACAGRPLIDWSLEVLEAVCDRVIVAVPPGYETGPDRVTGGASRSESVRLALAAAPVSDTIKEAGDDRRVVRTLDRSRLWAIQTPQAFAADALRRALDSGDLASATDDASLVEEAGGSIRVVEAPPENIKVTSQVDLRLAETLLC